MPLSVWYWRCRDAWCSQGTSPLVCLASPYIVWFNQVLPFLLSLRYFCQPCLFLFQLGDGNELLTDLPVGGWLC